MKLSVLLVVFSALDYLVMIMTHASAMVLVVVIIDDNCVYTHLYHQIFPCVHKLQSVENKTVFCGWQMNAAV
jgi:hypothetical protein